MAATAETQSPIAKASEKGTLAKLVPPGGKVAPIVPSDIEQAFRMASIIVSSNMVPKAFERNAEKVMVAILHGMEVGFTPMAALQSIAVINGNPSIWGDGAMALVQGSGHLEDIEEKIEGEGDNRVATCTLQRKGRKTPTVRTFSVAQAKQANLWGKAGPWSQYPERMLQMRARAFALRDAFADILKGLHIAEEARDMPVVGNNVDNPPPPPPKRDADQHGDADKVIDVEPEVVTEDDATFQFVDQFGEVDDGPYSAAQFAELLGSAMNSAIIDSDDMEFNALTEFNQDAIDAMPEDQKQELEGYVEAYNKRKRQWMKDNPQDAPEELKPGDEIASLSDFIVDVPKENGMVKIPAYIAAIEAELKAIGTLDALAMFRKANEKTIADSLKGPWLRKATDAVNARQKELEA